MTTNKAFLSALEKLLDEAGIAGNAAMAADDSLDILKHLSKQRKPTIEIINLCAHAMDVLSDEEMAKKAQEWWEQGVLLLMMIDARMDFHTDRLLRAALKPRASQLREVV